MQRFELWDAWRAEGVRTDKDQNDYYTYNIIIRQDCHPGGEA